MLKENQFDYVQPDHPLFNEIYKNRPCEQMNKMEENRRYKKKEFEYNREERLKWRVRQGTLKPWELADINSYVKDRGL